MHRDLPGELSAANNTHLGEDEYHSLLSKRGCDPIGCYANGHFSVLFDACAANQIRLYGENQPMQSHPLNCNGNYYGFNSWLPWVFMVRILLQLHYENYSSANGHDFRPSRTCVV
jgi:hypothetical protein